MSKILAFTSGPDDWKALLADPVKHWRPGYSARTLAYCWEAADGFPPEVAQALSQSDSPLLADLTPRSERLSAIIILSDMDAEIAALEQRRDKTRALKQGMMQELLTGRIRLV